MQTAHIIDEVIFDLSFAAISIADDHESKVSAWITQQILPAVDSVLNEFDQAKTVLRLDLVEVELGDVTEDAFQAALMQRLRERLGSMLRGARASGESYNADAVVPSRVSYAQVELEQLRFFLMTGKMAGHVSTSSRQVHEQILARVLQESSDAFIQFLQQSPVKRTLIDRLVKQFAEPNLINLLHKIIPTHAVLILNLLDVYRATITEKHFVSATNVASIDALWTSILDVVLEKTNATKSSVTVMNAVIDKLMRSSAPDSADLIKKMQRVATRLTLDKNINVALPRLLADVREHQRDVVKQKDGHQAGKRQQKAQKSERTTPYQRIIQALKAAKIAAFHPLVKGLRKNPAKIRERLARQGKKATIREQLAERLTDDILLDITDLFMPAAVNYFIQLLAQSGRLHQGVGEAAWKQQLWESNLSYLFTESPVAFIPADYLQALASLMSPVHDAESVLRVWHAELSTSTNAQVTEQSLPNLLQQLVADEDRSLPLAIDQHPSDSDAYKTLIQRLQRGAPQDVPPLQPVLAELAQAYPAQWQRIHEAMRSGTLSTANLSAHEQQQLLIAFIDQAPTFNAENRAIFIQAITGHAESAADPSTYYQQILQALLHDQPVDLEAIQKNSVRGESDTTVPRIKTKEAVRGKRPALVDRTTQYQRIVQALEETEIAGFYPLPEGLQQHPVMIRQLLAEHGKQATTRQQLAVKLTDKTLVDITDLYIPAAVSYIEQLLAHAGVLHQGEGEVAWKKRLWESNLSYLFTEANTAFIPADYLKALARLMSPSHDAPSVLVAWHQLLYTSVRDPLAEQSLSGLLQQLVVDKDQLVPLAIDQLPSSAAFKTLVQRLQSGAPQDAPPLQPVLAELAQAYPAQLQRVYDAIRGGTLSTARLNAAEQQQLLTVFIDHSSEFNAESRTAFIQAIASHAESAADPSTYCQRILQALLHDQPVDLEAIQKNSARGENDTAVQRLKTEEAVRGKRPALVDRTVQYQRIIQALQAAETAEFRPLVKGLRKNPAKIRERLATQGKKTAIRGQLAECLTDDILLDITDLFIPAAVSYLKQLLAQSNRLHQGAGEAAWKQQLWKSNLSYLFTEAHIAFIPADYLPALAKLMSPAHDAEPVLRVWHVELSTSSNAQAAEQSLSGLLQQLVVDKDQLVPLAIDQLPSSAAFKTLVQRLQSGAPQDAPPLQPVLAELAQAYPAQLQRVYDAIRGGSLSTTRLNVTEQQQLLTVFIDQSPEFNAESRTVFIQAITSHAEGAADPSTYYQRILQALLLDQPVDLEAIQKNSARDENDTAVQHIKTEEAVRGKELVTLDRTVQYQRIIQALQAAETAEFRPLVKGLRKNPAKIRERLARQGKKTAIRGQLAERLTDDILLDITDLFIPAAVSYFKQLLAQSHRLHQGVGEAAWKQQLWKSNLSYLFTEVHAAFIPADYLSALARLMSPAHDAEPVLRVWHVELSTTTSAQAAEQSLSGLLQQLVADESAASDVVASAETIDQRSLFDAYDMSASVHDIETKEMIEISNAGQIIAAPYLPRLFQMLKLVNDESSFVSLEAAERAVHLLQFMVDEQSESPEYMLILNKILCGIPTAVPIRRQLSLSEHEKTVVEDLIKGMIQNWKVIGNTSVSGFRQTFLQRDGGLLLEDDAWHLTVQPGTFDMLLDGLPWSFSIVKHAWMDKAIHVDWR